VFTAAFFCSDLFGLKHFAANYTTLQFAPAIGSYLLATEVTGWLYDRAAEAHGDIHQVRRSALRVLACHQLQLLMLQFAQLQQNMQHM
jgi:hypothetical protein